MSNPKPPGRYGYGNDDECCAKCEYFSAEPCGHINMTSGTTFGVSMPRCSKHGPTPSFAVCDDFAPREVAHAERNNG